MDSIDLLEKRMEALELLVLPTNPDQVANNTQAITDLLSQTGEMINSALCCREAITSILRHVTTINGYLDPHSEENVIEAEAKRQYLLELYPELRDTVQLMGNFENLLLYTDSDNVTKITELYEKLNQLSVTNLNIYEECRETTQHALKALLQYNDITRTIKILFAQLDKAITDLESALQPKFVTEE